MKKQILSEELLRMKRLSGLISESQYESMLDEKRAEKENQETIEEVFKNVNGKISVVLSPDLDQDYQLKNHAEMLKNDFDRLTNYNITKVAEQKNNPPMWYFNINAGSTLSLGFHLDDVEGNIRWSVYSPVDANGTTHYIGTMDIENNIITNIKINDNNVMDFLKAALAK
jgi:hypothetical protein